jgi:hypothetical protein
MRYPQAVIPGREPRAKLTKSILSGGGTLDQNSAMLLDDLFRQLIVTVERAPPGLIAHGGSAAAGARYFRARVFAGTTS